VKDNTTYQQLIDCLHQQARSSVCHTHTTQSLTNHIHRQCTLSDASCPELHLVYLIMNHHLTPKNVGANRHFRPAEMLALYSHGPLVCRKLIVVAYLYMLSYT